MGDRDAARALTLDITDAHQLTEAMQAADLVANASGPFHRFGCSVVEAAIAGKARYVDVCDEYDVTADIFNDAALDQAARANRESASSWDAWPHRASPTWPPPGA